MISKKKKKKNKKKRSSPKFRVIFWPKFKAFFRPKFFPPKKKKRSSPKLRLLFRPISQIQTFEGGLFSNGGGYFSFFTENRPQKHKKHAILHTSQANGGGSSPPRPPPGYATGKMVLCFAPGCDHTSEKSSCKFYRFSKNINLASKWESRCSLACFIIKTNHYMKSSFSIED